MVNLRFLIEILLLLSLALGISAEENNNVVGNQGGTVSGNFDGDADLKIQPMIQKEKVDEIGIINNNNVDHSGQARVPNSEDSLGVATNNEEPDDHLDHMQDQNDNSITNNDSDNNNDSDGEKLKHSDSSSQIGESAIMNDLDHADPINISIEEKKDEHNKNNKINNKEEVENHDNEIRFEVEEPLTENGLLVLDHDNLLETITGGTLKYNKNNDNNNSNMRTLLLLAFHEPWCQLSIDMIQKLEHAAHIIRENFAINMNMNIPPPMFGKMDTSSFDNDDLIEFFALFDSKDNGLPALKFVYIEQNEAARGENSSSNSASDSDKSASNTEQNEQGQEQGNDGVERTIIDFVGESKTAEDIVETVIHYWYRFVVSSHISYETMQEVKSVQSKERTKKLDGNIIPIRPIFTFPNMDSITSFVQSHHNIFHPVRQHLTSVSEREEAYIRKLFAEEEGYHDPFLAFVQCQGTSLDTVDADRNAFQRFDDLAQTFIYRRDTAFFVVKSQDCDWIAPSKKDDDDNDEINESLGWNGSVRVFKMHSTTHHMNDNENTLNWTSGDIFHHQHIHDSSLNMTQFAIVQSTPPILWYDKFSASTIAFPIYRQVHMVLFIDMHTTRLSDGSFNYSSVAFEESKYAISHLRKAAIHHSRTRPSEDVVFLIVPSTEIQIMTTFGIDIWSGMDHDCTISNLKNCYPKNIPLLPMGMITSRKENNSMMMRFYLHSDRLINNDESNPIKTFLGNYLSGKLIHKLKSEPSPTKRTLSSGVQILTGNNFNELVMLQTKKHTIVQFYAPHCGHCKRFNVIWKELGELIHHFHWGSMIDVMMMDVTKNDVMHEMIDLVSLPSVYFFPKGEKDSPIEMNIQGDSQEDASKVGGINDVYTILEWMVDTNVFESEELLNLIEGNDLQSN